MIEGEEEEQESKWPVRMTEEQREGVRNDLLRSHRPCLKIARRWGVSHTTVNTMKRKLIEQGELDDG